MGSAGRTWMGARLPIRGGSSVADDAVGEILVNFSPVLLGFYLAIRRKDLTFRYRLEATL